MALRPEGPGKDFDDMWNRHYREAAGRKERGEGPYAADAALKKIQEQPMTEPTMGGRHAKAASDSCVTALALLGGLGWALSELAGRVF